MKVTLLNWTKDADSILIFSKKTRLSMSPKGYEDIKNLSNAEKEEELKYVFGTIGSSWEFVDYVFLIEGVSRAFTHQIVRHRVGVSFAQQSQRAVDMSEGFEYISTGKCKGNKIYDGTMGIIQDQYKRIVEQGIDIQDARGILPTNISTNIMMKINLRALSGFLNERLCYRVQGEFQEVAREMKRLVSEIHPWAKPVLQVNCVQYGVCPFKNYKECPMKLKGLVKDIDTTGFEEVWKNIYFNAQPKGVSK